jgi:hypothetical protein
MNFRSRVELVSCVVLLFGCLGCFTNLALAQAGVPVPEDSPVFNAFRLLEKQSGYRMRMNMEISDPQMARIAQSMGMSALEKIVKGDTQQASMHWKMPAMDARGAVDDWEIKAVFRNGHGARLISTPAEARILKSQDQMIAMQMMMAERQSAMVIAEAAAMGPMGAVTAALAAASMAQAAIAGSMASKQAHDFFKWKCLDQPADSGEKKNVNLLTDLKSLGEKSMNGAAANAYEFYTRDKDQLRGPVRLYVAKDSGLPQRIEMNDPQGHGAMHMDYDYSAVGEIEIPDCLAKATASSEVPHD